MAGAGVLLMFYMVLAAFIFRGLFSHDIAVWAIGDHGDAWHFMWNFWWFETAVTSSKPLLETTYIFYPEGTTLLLHTYNLSSMVLFSPLILGLESYVLSYNLVVISSYVLSAFSAFLLASYLLRQWADVDDYFLPAAAAGIIYGFSPWAISKHFGFFNLITLFYLPLAFLLLVLSYDRGDRRLVPLLVATPLVLFLADPQYLLFFALMAGGFLSYVFATEKMDWQNLKIIGTGYALGNLLLYILVQPGIKKLQSGHYWTGSSIEINSVAQGFFIPSDRVLSFYILPESLKKASIVGKLGLPPDSIGYLGLGLLSTVLVLAYHSWDRETLFEREAFFVYMGLFAFVLSIGELSGISMALDAAVDAVVPYMALVNNNLRYSMITTLCLGIVTALVLGRFGKEVSRRKYHIAAAAVFLLLFIDFVPLTETKVYSSYFAVDVPPNLTELDEGGTVLNIPADANTQGMYLQTFHEIPVHDGHISQKSDRVDERLGSYNELVATMDRKKIGEQLRSEGIKYVILNTYWRGDSTHFQPVDVNVSEIRSFMDGSFRRITSSSHVYVYDISES